MPEPISNSQKWLRQCKPTNVDPDKQPPASMMQKFQHVLRQSHKLANELGVDDAGAILKEAKRRMVD
jgi:hypothetical protein